MAKHDIVLLNTTSSGFETDLGSNVARIKGDADNLFSVRNSSEVNKFAVSSVENSMIIGGDLTLTGNLSSSLNSTASFGKIVATKFIGDATQMTNTNQTSHVSSSKQLQARISGAFTAGFTTTGDISGSATSTGSFTKVVANTYVGSGAQLFDPPSVTGEISGSAQIASDISGSFTSGFTPTKTAIISGSGTSTGSFGTFVMGPTIGLQQTVSDTSELTGLPSFDGFISSSAQLASSISGSFTSGMSMFNSTISGSATSTASFGRVDGIVSITGDASQVSGLAIPTDSVSGSAQLATSISESFNKGFEFDNSISGSATSTGSFARLNFNSLSVTDLSGITGHETGHASGSSVIAAGISASFQGGFGFSGTISGSSPSDLLIHNLNVGGTSTFGSTNLIKNWNSSFVRTATYGTSIGSDISGSFNHGFGFKGTISGSATSTGSFSKIKSKRVFVKEMVGVRKPISGSIGHDTYISASYKSDSHGRVTIPVRGRVDHSVVTKQFTATGSMESQKYRDQAGQLFVDNWGRLNMTVQTGSMIAQPAAWTLVNSGPTLSGRWGGVIFQSTKAGMGLPGQGTVAPAGFTIWDGVTVSAGGQMNHAIPHCGWSHGYQGFGNGVNDAMQAGAGFGYNQGCKSQIYDGTSWSRSQKLPFGIYSSNGQPKTFNAPGVSTSGGAAIVSSGPSYQVVEWSGVSWELGGKRSNSHCAGMAGGSVYAGLAAGGKNPAGYVAETEEYNGTSWSTSNNLPHASDGPGGGTQNASVTAEGMVDAPHAHGSYGAGDGLFEYNGTSWYSGTDMPNAPNGLREAGGQGTGGGMALGPGLTGPSGATIAIYEPAFVTGSVETYNNFSQNPTGKYLLTKKLQANYSPGTSGGGSTSSEDGFGGGY